jgi:hypothetical protein
MAPRRMSASAGGYPFDAHEHVGIPARGRRRPAHRDRHRNADEEQIERE